MTTSSRDSISSPVKPSLYLNELRDMWQEYRKSLPVVLHLKKEINKYIYFAIKYQEISAVRLSKMLQVSRPYIVECKRLGKKYLEQEGGDNK